MRDSMFSFQAPFECDKQLYRSSLSESEKNLYEISSNTTKTLFHSDSNIFGSCGSAESTKRERWKIKSRTALSLKNARVFDEKTSFKRTEEKLNEVAVDTCSSSVLALVEHCMSFVQTSPDKTVRVASCDTLSPSLHFFRTSDVEFIDESKNGGQENVEVENDCRSSDKTPNYVTEIKNQKSENHCLQNKMSIINLKAMKNNSLQHLSYSEILEGIDEKNISVKTELKQNSVQNDFQAFVHLNSDLDVDSKNESCRDTNLLKSGNKSLKRQKINSGTSFLSLCSLFSFSKSPNKSIRKIFSKNNEAEFYEQNASIIFQQNILNTSLSCCPLSSQKTKSMPVEVLEKDKKHQLSNIVIINKSPKPKNKTLFSDIHSLVNDGSLDYKSDSFFSSDSSSGDTSLDGIAPMASSEVISIPDSQLSFPKLIDYSSGQLSRQYCRAIKFKDSLCEPNFSSSLSVGCAVPSAKLKMLHEGDVQVCYLSHTRTIFRKVLSSKLLRRWENHHIYLSKDCLCSKTPTGCLESPIFYSNLDEVYAVNRWDQGNRFCIRLVMADGSLLLQTSNSLVRDQWLSSILWKKNMHKYKNILHSSTRPEVILKEIKVCDRIKIEVNDILLWGSYGNDNFMTCIN